MLRHYKRSLAAGQIGAGEQGSRNFVRAIISSLATAPPGDDLVRAARICAGSLELV
jgi:hypothetical protein